MQWVVQSKVFLILCCSLFLTNLSSALATSSSSKPDPIDQLNSTAAWEGNCIVACDRSSLSFSGTYLHREERNQNKGIAFSAIRNEDNLYELPQPNSKVVIFDYVPVNLGNAYNKQTSEFTASVSGVFKFDFSVIKHFSRESLTVAMTVNEEPIFVAFADENTANHEAAQNGGVLFLKVGDVVRVEVQNGRLDTNWEKSTFSGFLIYESEF